MSLIEAANQAVQTYEEKQNAEEEKRKQAQRKQFEETQEENLSELVSLLKNKLGDVCAWENAKVHKDTLYPLVSIEQEGLFFYIDFYSSVGYKPKSQLGYLAVDDHLEFRLLKNNRSKIESLLDLGVWMYHKNAQRGDENVKA